MTLQNIRTGYLYTVRKVFTLGTPPKLVITQYLRVKELSELPVPELPASGDLFRKSRKGKRPSYTDRTRPKRVLRRKVLYWDVVHNGIKFPAGF